jgi:hypothetical protein
MARKKSKSKRRCASSPRPEQPTMPASYTTSWDLTPHTRGQITPKARRTAASHLTSHTRHGDNQAGNTSRQTNPPSLTVP